MSGLTRLLPAVWLAGLAVAGLVSAQTLDPASTEALRATLRALQDPALRGAAIGADPKAAAADSQIRNLAGSPQLTEEIYALAAEVFEDLARGSGGDATKMAQALEGARTDPAGFAAMLSPRTLEHLRALSVKLSDQRR